MPAGYWVSVSLHVLAALFWIGGMLFLAVVGAPVLRGIEPPALRQRLFRELGVRFRSAGWAALALLVVTGVVNLYYRGWLNALGDAAFWRTATGTALAWKLGAVLAMLLLQGVHDVVVGPRASRVSPGSPASLALRSRAALLARASAIVSVIIVLAAVRLARGG